MRYFLKISLMQPGENPSTLLHAEPAVQRAVQLLGCSRPVPRLTAPRGDQNTLLPQELSISSLEHTFSSPALHSGNGHSSITELGQARFEKNLPGRVLILTFTVTRSQRTPSISHSLLFPLFPHSAPARVRYFEHAAQARSDTS